MIKGILIGIGLTLGIEILMILYIYFNEVINQKISWLFSPIFHPFVAFYLVKIGLNPWKLSINKILSLNDEQFEGWLKVIGKKHREDWKFAREKRKKKDILKNT